MSVRRRRLLGTGAVGVVACFTILALSSPPAHAHAEPHSLAPTIATTTAGSLDDIVLRPLTVLREPGQSGLVIGHRGLPDAAPENTLPALSAAIASGVDYIEIDIRMTRDSVPVVMHDRTVDRTTDGAGAVADLTLAEVRALDAGSWFSEAFAGTRVPTLQEVLTLAARTRTAVVVEYKGHWSRGDIRTTVEMIDAAGLDKRVITQSFNKKTVANITAVAPELIVGWLTEQLDAKTVQTAAQLGADAVNPSSASWHGVYLAHRARLSVFVWTQDAASDWDALTAMGVDGIITNASDELRTWIRERDDARPAG